MSEANRCAMCVHWNRKEADSSVGICGNVEMKEVLRAPGNYPQPYVLTKDDFGCVLWKDKEEAKDEEYTRLRDEASDYDGRD